MDTTTKGKFSTSFLTPSLQLKKLEKDKKSYIVCGKYVLYVHKVVCKDNIEKKDKTEIQNKHLEMFFRLKIKSTLIGEHTCMCVSYD